MARTERRRWVYERGHTVRLEDSARDAGWNHQTAPSWKLVERRRARRQGNVHARRDPDNAGVTDLL
jgi:hypothetical protein